MWPFKKKKWSGAGYDLAVVGLGNPGPEYVGTRHNVGFDCVDMFASEHGLKWTGRRGPLKWAEGRVTIEGSAKRVLLGKPRTFMNLSGEAVTTSPPAGPSPRPACSSSTTTWICP